jgi:hypothetical protein
MEAIEVLRPMKRVGKVEAEALEVIISEILNHKYLGYVLTTLASELKHSRNPVFSYEILLAIALSGNPNIENDVAMRTMFINKTLETGSVQKGLLRCMLALSICTKATGN